jgi:hypothetical protein
MIGSGVYPFDGWGYWGSDNNNNLFCIGFYRFVEPDSVYQVILSYGLANVDTWDLAMPSPYNPCIEYTQLALTDSGSPLLVFNWRDLTDSTYPYRSKIYVSYASGLPPVEITSPFPVSECKCIYPTIATGGNSAVVIFNKPRNALPDSLCWMDIYRSYSLNNGRTWSIPENITHWSTWRLGLQQLAKRIDTSRNRFYYIFARNKRINHDPLWHLLYNPIGADPMDIYWGYAQITGIEASEKLKYEDKRLGLMVTPSVITGRARIQWTIPEKRHISLNLYDIVGRKVETITDGVFEPGSYSYELDSYDFSSGIYFLILEDEKELKKAKVLILR